MVYGGLACCSSSPALVRDVLPGTTVFALGLAIVVAPLTALILADADERTRESPPGTTTRSSASRAGCARRRRRRRRRRRQIPRPRRPDAGPGSAWLSATLGLESAAMATAKPLRLLGRRSECEMLDRLLATVRAGHSAV